MTQLPFVLPGESRWRGLGPPRAGLVVRYVRRGDVPDAILAVT